MASVWITTRQRKDGGRGYRVMYRLGGREAKPRYGGSFRTKREALLRKQWIAGELAAMRVPEIDLRPAAPVAKPTFLALAEAWQRARVDVSLGTAQTYRVALGRVVPTLGSRAADEIKPADIAALVSGMAESGLKTATIRKTVNVVAQILDHHGVEPNPARDRQVKLPRAERRELQPPTMAHVLAVHDLLPSRYRLPLLVLDATGMRVGELESLRWGDVDEPRARWRISAGSSKTGRARWVQVSPVLFQATIELRPREDRDADARVFAGFAAEPFRTALARACRAAGIPAFSPHDLRHRRVSMLHAQGLSWASIGELVGHADLMTTVRTYTHVIADEGELDYAHLLGR